MVNGAKRLPDGWKQKTLKEITKLIYRYPTFYGMEHLSKGVPVIRGEHINSDGGISHNWTDYWFVSNEISNSFPRTIVELDDLIMSVRGSVGKIGIIDEALKGAQVSPNCIRISLDKDSCYPKFLLYYLKSSYGKSLIQDNVNATTIQTIKASLLSQTIIPIPPLPEQERIVAKIEELFTQLEAGTSALERVQAGLRRYKASVLKAAVEGKIGIQKDEFRMGEGELPEGWQMKTVGEVSVKIQYGTSEKANINPSGIPVLRMGNIQEGQLDFTNLKYLSGDAPGVKDLILDDGDLIFNRTNSAELVGKTAVYKSNTSKSNICFIFDSSQVR